jgi:hypothetical protein
MSTNHKNVFAVGQSNIQSIIQFSSSPTTTILRILYSCRMMNCMLLLTWYEVRMVLRAEVLFYKQIVSTLFVAKTLLGGVENTLIFS